MTKAKNQYSAPSPADPSYHTSQIMTPSGPKQVRIGGLSDEEEHQRTLASTQGKLKMGGQ